MHRLAPLRTNNNGGKAEVCESKDFHADLSKQTVRRTQLTASDSSSCTDSSTVVVLVRLRRFYMPPLLHRSDSLEMTELSVIHAETATGRSRRTAASFSRSELQACTLISSGVSAT